MIDACLTDNGGGEGQVLPILHSVQHAFGYVDTAAGAAIAALKLSRAEVRGVVSFYHNFKAEANARLCVELCQTEAYQARCVAALVAPADAARKFVVCNADEGDSGTFADRILMEVDPFQSIERVAISANEFGAHG